MRNIYFYIALCVSYTENNYTVVWPSFLKNDGEQLNEFFFFLNSDGPTVKVVARLFDALQFQYK